MPPFRPLRPLASDAVLLPGLGPYSQSVYLGESFTQVQAAIGRQLSAELEVPLGLPAELAILTIGSRLTLSGAVPR